MNATFIYNEIKIVLSVFDHFVGLALKGLRLFLVHIKTVCRYFSHYFQVFEFIFITFRKGL